MRRLKAALSAATVRVRGSASCDEGAEKNHRITVLGCRRSGFGHFKICLKKAHGKRLCREEDCLIFKDHPQAQEQSTPSVRKSGKKWQVVFMGEQGVPGQTETPKGSVQKVKLGTSIVERIQRCCLNMKGEVFKEKCKLNLICPVKVKDKRVFHNCIHDKKKSRENVGPLLNR